MRLLHEQSKIPGCDECTAHEENPEEFIEEQVCPACVHSMEVDDPAIFKLLHYMDMIEAGCPIGRHELTDTEWLALGMLRAECRRIAQEEAEAKNER